MLLMLLVLLTLLLLLLLLPPPLFKAVRRQSNIDTREAVPLCLTFSLLLLLTLLLLSLLLPSPLFEAISGQSNVDSGGLSLLLLGLLVVSRLLLLLLLSGLLILRIKLCCQGLGGNIATLCNITYTSTLACRRFVIPSTFSVAVVSPSLPAHRYRVRAVTWSKAAANARAPCAFMPTR